MPERCWCWASRCHGWIAMGWPACGAPALPTSARSRGWSGSSAPRRTSPSRWACAGSQARPPSTVPANRCRGWGWARAAASAPPGSRPADGRGWGGAGGLAPRSAQRPARLSAAERQRLATARALATGADLLLVDEPTSRLDQANAESVAALLAEAAAGRSLAVVCATHDPLLIESAGVEMRLDEEQSAAEASVSGAGAVAD